MMADRRNPAALDLALGGLYKGDLIGVHRIAALDRYIFAGGEPFLAKVKSCFDVVLAGRIVKIPLPARLAPKPAYPVLFRRVKMAHPAILRMPLPFMRINAALFIEWRKEIIALFA
jgi:hypothetical protein